MSKNELISSAIVSHIHIIQASLTPLLVTYKIGEVSLRESQQIYTVYTKLTELLNKTLDTHAKFEEKANEEIYERLFEDLRAEARKLYSIITSLIATIEIPQEEDVSELLWAVEKALRISLLL